MTNEYHHLQPPYFYLIVAFAGLLPWPFFLLGAFSRLKKLAARDSEGGELLLLAWVWAIIPIAFFSISKSKLPAYILPSFPPLSILIGWEIERIWRGEIDVWGKIGLGLTSAVAAIIGIAFVVAVFKEGVSVSGLGFIGLVLPPLIGLCALVAFALQKREAATGATMALTTSVILAAMLLLFPHLSYDLSRKELSVAAFQALKPGENLVYYQKEKEYAPVFYARGRVIFTNKLTTPIKNRFPVKARCCRPTRSRPATKSTP